VVVPSLNERNVVVSLSSGERTWFWGIMQKFRDFVNGKKGAKKGWTVPRPHLVVSCLFGFRRTFSLLCFPLLETFPCTVSMGFPIPAHGQEWENCFPCLRDFALSLTEYTFMSPQSRKPDGTFLFNSNNCQRRKAISYLQGGVRYTTSPLQRENRLKCTRA